MNQGNEETDSKPNREPSSDSEETDDASNEDCQGSSLPLPVNDDYSRYVYNLRTTPLTCGDTHSTGPNWTHKENC